MAKKVAERGVFSAEVVADALSSVGQISCDQRAVMIAPWRASGWSALAADVAHVVPTYKGSLVIFGIGIIGQERDSLCHFI